MTSPLLAVIGCINSDINITPESETHLPGGGGYFSALGASLVTTPVGLAAKIGDDFDASFLFNRVLPEGVQVIRGGKTTTSVQIYHNLHDLTDRDIEIRDGVSFELTPDLFPETWKEFVTHVHVSTLPPDLQWTFLKFVRDEMPNAILSVDTDRCFFDDPQKVQQIEKNLRHADIVFLNRREAEKFAKVLTELEHAVVKQDKDGASVYSFGNKIAEAIAEKVKVEDATGAGDILAGAYMAALSKKESIQSALKKAVALATNSVQKSGVRHLFE